MSKPKPEETAIATVPRGAFDEPAAETPAKPPSFEDHVIEARRAIDAPEITHIPHVLHHIVAALELASAERVAK